MVELTAEERWNQLDALRAHYPTFAPFLYDVMTGVMGFECSPMQLDIADYLESGPLYRMIQAQRGEAKTTIAAIYCVWRLIHRPSDRIVIMSAGGAMADQIANWVIQVIENFDVLECMRPDRKHGDRASIEEYDIHWQLKGPEKSPSIASLGITSNSQGYRADVFLADDIESAKNSQTEGQRERLRHLTLDFTSVCADGDIIYLGTPQSIDSVYNGLVSRGYDIRVWPGRYPTEEEETHYGGYLAPSIIAAMKANPNLRTGGGMDGTRGQATDPIMKSEHTLTKKEMDQGKSYFQLQYMLDTRLADKDRFPLKAEKIIFMKIPENTCPIEIHHLQSPDFEITKPPNWPVEVKYYRASRFGNEYGKFADTVMYVDPAGGGRNGDETAYAIVRFMAGKLFVVAVGAVGGGVDKEQMDALTAVAVKYKPKRILVEENFGSGIFGKVWTPYLQKAQLATIEDVWESGQKELRIIDVLEPLVGAGKLIMDIDLLEFDRNSIAEYPSEKRASYSLFFQFSRITRDKGALKHDDRLDALAGACRPFADNLRQDEEKVSAAAKRAAWAAKMKDPLGNGRPVPNYKSQIKQNSMLTRMHRRV